MNQAIELLNWTGARWADLAWAGLWQSSILIAGIWLADRLLRRRVRPVVRHALWVLVPVKLLLPPSLALPTGLGYWIPRPWQAEAQARFSSWRVEHGAESGVGVKSAPALPVQPAWARPPRPDVTVPAVCLIAWAAGVTVLLAVMVRRSLALRRSLGEVEAASDGPARRLADMAEDLRLPRPVAFRWVAAGQGPALFGLWRQSLLMPRSLDGSLSPAQLRGVLLHELVHARRGDVWLHVLQVLAQVLWWWHPLVWLSGARLRAVREEAVDDEVAFRLGPEAGTYPEALLAVARATVRRPPLSLGLLGIVESRSALRSRIERMLDDPPTRLPRLGRRGWLAVGVVGLLLIPMAGGQPSRDTAGADGGPTVGRITALEVRHKTGVDGPLDAGQEPDSPSAADAPSGADEPRKLKTRVYRLELERLIAALERRLGRPLGEDSATWAEALREVLKTEGFSLEPPNALFLKLRTAELMVRGPGEQLEIVQTVLDGLMLPEIVLVEAAFLEATRDVLAAILPDLAAGAPGDGTAGKPARPVSVEEHRRLLGRALAQDGVRLIGRPRVTTLHGREAEIRQTEGPTNSPTTLSLRVQPEVAADRGSVRLESVVRWTQVLDGRTLRDRTAEARERDVGRGVEGALPTANAAWHVGRSVTNTVVVKDGGACLIGGLGVAAGAGGSDLARVVLVKAVLIDGAGNPLRREVP